MWRLDLSIRNLEKRFDLKRASEIVQVDETKKSVNEILNKKRVFYIVSEDSERVNLKEDEYAFEIDAIKITWKEWNEEVIALKNSESFKINWENIKIWEKTYPYKNFSSTKIIWVVKKDSITRKKPKKDYYKEDKKEYRQYIKPSDIIKSYPNAKKKEISLMELTSLKELSEDEQIAFLTNYFENFDLDNENFLEKINELFNFAKEILETRNIYYLRETKTFKKLKNLEIDSKEKALSLLRWASEFKKDKKATFLYCTILKFMFLYNEAKKEDLFDLLEKIDIWTVKVEDIITDIFNLPRNTEIKVKKIGYQKIYVFKKVICWVETTISLRIKDIKSMMVKSFSRWECINTEGHYDTLAMTVHIPKKDRSKRVDIAKELDLYFTNSRWYAKNKKGLKTKDVTWLDSKNREDKKYIRAFEKNEKRIWTAENYDDFKIIWKWYFEKKEWRDYIKEWFFIWIEMKFFIWDYEDIKREKGMAFHPIYDHFAKVLRIDEREKPFIFVDTIKNLIDDLYNKVLTNEQILSDNEVSKIELFWEIYKDLTGKNLPRINSSRALKNIYFSELREKVFEYLQKSYGFKYSTIDHKTVLITKKGSEKIEEGGRGFEFKE